MLLWENNGKHHKHIKNNEFLKDMFIACQTNVNFVTVLQEKLIEMLKTMGESRGTLWVKGTLN